MNQVFLLRITLLNDMGASSEWELGAGWGHCKNGAKTRGLGLRAVDVSESPGNAGRRRASSGRASMRWARTLMTP